MNSARLKLGWWMMVGCGLGFLPGTIGGAASGSNAPTAAMSGLPAGDETLGEEDHQHMMDLLHIISLRRGRDGNDPQSPFYANYDEARANPFTVLPDPLRLKNGRAVTTAEMWWRERRPEIVEDFDREIYGRVPRNAPVVHWRILSFVRETNGTVPVLTKKLAGRADNSADTNITVNIQLSLSTPAAARGPVPIIMQLNFDLAAFFRLRGTNGFFLTAGNVPGSSWQQQVLARGWGYATLTPSSIQADNGAGLTQGVIGLANRGQLRRPDDWGVLRAWAWGASRALDYFASDPMVDARQVGLEGHSRYGKAVLVAMAYDPRFAVAYVSSSGAGGAKLWRRNWGETLENLAGSGESHWMAGNFLKYAGPMTANDLPVDAHELIALCAPRPVFISGGATQGDGWVDAKGMFMAAVAAGPVYTLLGEHTMGTTNFPSVGTGLIDGEIAFRQHSAGHTDRPNWPTFLQFASRYIKIASGNGSENN